jgi:putative hemolysin
MWPLAMPDAYLLAQSQAQSKYRFMSPHLFDLHDFGETQSESALVIHHLREMV